MKEKVVEKHAGVIRSSRWEDGMGDFVVTQMVSQQGGLTFVFRPLLADVLTTSARVYRVTKQLVPNFPLTLKQRLRFGAWA